MRNHSISGARVGLLAVMVVLTLLMMAYAAPAAWAAEFTVTNTNDSGTGSLRQAILDANTNAGPDTIKFDIADDPDVAGNEVKTISPTAQLPIISDPVVIDGETQDPSTGAGTPDIELNGLNAGAVSSGLVLDASGITVRGLVINRFRSVGIYIAPGGSGNRVQGNYIGTDASGAADLGNARTAVSVHAPDNVVGGTEAGATNVLSGNRNGVWIEGAGASGNRVQGNYIGTDASGAADLGNSSSGVSVHAPDNVVGGTEAGATNVLSGNRNGVWIQGAGASGNRVQGNYIGTDASGAADLGNSADGVAVFAPDNIVGGTEAGAANVISGNDSRGIWIQGAGASGNRVQGNYIGTDNSGTADLGNSADGVLFIEAAHGNIVGGTEAGAANVIAFNDYDGVKVDGSTSTANAILSNSVFSNGGLGIDLGVDGVTANDPGDADTGPNDLQNFPELRSAFTSNGSTQIKGTLNSIPGETFTVQFFSSPQKDPSGHGEGKKYLGEQSVTTDSNGNAEVTFASQDATAGEFVSATATASNSSTSEFSSAVAVSYDTTAPSVSCSATPSKLKTSANNHKLVNIAASVNVTDNFGGSGADGFELVSVTSNQADSGLGRDDVPNDIQGWALGTADLSGQLRTERYGADRTYTLTYRGKDLVGNVQNCQATVRVSKG